MRNSEALSRAKFDYSARLAYRQRLTIYQSALSARTVYKDTNHRYWIDIELLIACQD